MSAFAADAERPLLQIDGILPPEVLKESPSAKHGISAATEFRYRSLGCEIIQEAAGILQLSAIGVATAQNILHRFYYRKSLHEFDVFSVSMGSVLVGSKAVDCQIVLRDILSAFFSVFRRRAHGTNSDRPPGANETLQIGSEQYIRWKSELVSVEMHVLKEIGFCLYAAMDHPHKYLLYLVDKLNCAVLKPAALAHANESMCTDLVLRYGSPAVAAACVYLAAREQQAALPDMQWYNAFDIRSLEHLQEVAEGVLCGRQAAHGGQEKVEWLDPIESVGEKESLFSRNRNKCESGVGGSSSSSSSSSRSSSSSSSAHAPPPPPARRSRFADA